MNVWASALGRLRPSRQADIGQKQPFEQMHGGVYEIWGDSWFASNESTKQVVAQSCIQRIDNQEMKIREKTEAFLGNIADLISRGSNKKLSFDDSRPDAEKVIRSGFELIAYAPPEMGHSALKVTIAVQAMLNVESKSDVDLVAQQSQNAMTEWPNQFFKLMDEFRDQKAKCQE